MPSEIAHAQFLGENEIIIKESLILYLKMDSLCQE
jgi:hypothetical protein